MFKNPIRKVVMGFVAQTVLRRVLPKAIPGGIAAIVVAEGVKYLLDKKKKNSRLPKPRASARKSHK